MNKIVSSRSLTESVRTLFRVKISEDGLSASVKGSSLGSLDTSGSVSMVIRVSDPTIMPPSSVILRAVLDLLTLENVDVDRAAV